MKKTIMHIDYDSFFASVEQQANPFLRGKPVAVTGGPSKRGIAVTASAQAKRLGVKTGMPMFEIEKLCPDIIAVRGDFKKYSYVHKQSLKIFNKYTDLVEPFSIDEAFLDITTTIKLFGSAEKIARMIKQDIQTRLGSYITCSIGIGPNKLMAKLVSDFNKPNGLFIVDDSNINEVLRSAELEDFCGIGPRLADRLKKMGINNVEQLQNADLNRLYKNFGNVAGSFLKSTSLGINHEKVKSIEFKEPVKSVSHQHTLAKNTRDPKIIRSNLRRLSEMVAKRLRKHGMMGRTIFIALRDSDRNWYGNNMNNFRHTDSGREIFTLVEKLYLDMKWDRETRLVAVGISNLIQKACKMEPLFEKDQRSEKINTIIDTINDRFGDFTIISADTLRADRADYKTSSFLRHE
jgi:DNA polymerase IV